MLKDIHLFYITILIIVIIFAINLHNYPRSDSLDKNIEMIIKDPRTLEIYTSNDIYYVNVPTLAIYSETGEKLSFQNISELSDWIRDVTAIDAVMQNYEVIDLANNYVSVDSVYEDHVIITLVNPATDFSYSSVIKTQ